MTVSGIMSAGKRKEVKVGAAAVQAVAAGGELHAHLASRGLEAGPREPVHDQGQVGGVRRDVHPQVPVDYTIPHEGQGNTSDAEEAEKAQVYATIRQLLQGRGHEEPDGPGRWPSATLSIEQQLRQLGRSTRCAWSRTILARVQTLRLQNRGWENLWARIVREVVRRGDAHYEAFAKGYLRWLRDEFGPQLIHTLCGPLTVAEMELAGEVEMATYQDYFMAIQG